MYKAILITTKGCEGCRIMRNILKKSISLSDKDITLEVFDCKDKQSREYIDKYKIEDFPATFLEKNDEVTFIWTGTYPEPVVSRWFQLYMK